jgi:cytochrome c-type biogenesis protein
MSTPKTPVRTKAPDAMDIETLRSTLEQANLASLAIGLAIGFVFSFNPVALAAIPVSLAYMTKAHAPQRTALLGSMLVLGMIVTHAMLGLIVGLGGGWIQRFIGREWSLMLGPAAIAMGLAWPGWIRLPMPPIPLACGGARVPGVRWHSALLSP